MMAVKRYALVILLALVGTAWGQRDTVAPREYDMFMLAGPSEKGMFPPGLNTTFQPYELRADETSDGYGYDLTKDGVLAKGTVPSGTSRVQDSSTVSGYTCYWHYSRLWRIDGTNLHYYAPDYKDVLVKQRISKIPFDEDTNPILAIVPVEPDSMCVAKLTGSYMIGNCADSRALFQRSDIIQELSVTNASNIIELDGIVFVSNGSGLIGYKGGKTFEASRTIRNSLSSLTHLALTADYDNKWVIGGSSMVYDMESKKIFKYSGTDFRFTTRQFHLPNWAAFAPGRIIFVVKHDDTEMGSLKYQSKYDDDAWGVEHTVRIEYGEGEYTLVREDLAEPRRMTQRFQLRITALSANKYIREIRFDQEQFSIDDPE